MKKNKLLFKLFIVLAILVSTLVITRVETFAQNNQPLTVQKEVSSNQTSESKSQVEKSPEKNFIKTIPTKKTDFKKSLFRFFKAMFGVFLSVLVIFLCLKIYKKLNFKYDGDEKNLDYDKILETPKSFKEAINLFLNKTDKR